MIFEFKGFKPIVALTAFVHPQATIIGNVILGENVYIGAGAVLRGDWGAVVVEDGCNVQENCTIHMFPGKTVYLRSSAHVGHGAIVHGAEIGENSMVGMNAVIMDDVVIGAESIIGALTFIKSGMQVPPRSIVVGNPGKVIKEVSDEMISWKTKGTQLYQTLPKDCHETLKPCTPLRKRPHNQPEMSVLYETWETIKNNGN